MNEPKKETVRITLPPRPTGSGTGPLSRETVRISLPTKAPSDSASTPKKESTKLNIATPPSAGGGSLVPPAAVSPTPVPKPVAVPTPVAKPAAPTAVKPPAPSVPVVPSSVKPAAPGAPTAVRPPTPGAAPVVPSPAKPVVPPAPGPKPPGPVAVQSPAAGIPKASVVMTPSSQGQNPGAMKKETARIQLPGPPVSGIPQPSTLPTVASSASGLPAVRGPKTDRGGSSSVVMNTGKRPSRPSRPEIESQPVSRKADTATLVLTIFTLIFSLVTFGIHLWVFMSFTPPPNLGF